VKRKGKSEGGGKRKVKEAERRVKEENNGEE